MSSILKFFWAALFLFFFIFSNAQIDRDTIYFDNNWSICEQPVAEYYRVCTLNKEANIYYKDTVVDYYSNGTIEMKGKYNKDGLKEGFFEFYYPNSLKKKNGFFKDNQMVGIWSFYDNSGKLKIQFDCKSSTDITPILIINPAGDTILKNGSGKFVFNTRNDLPFVFPASMNYTIKGEVEEGKKEGLLIYSNTFSGIQFNRTEIYKNGQFKKGKDSSLFRGSYVTNEPFNFLDLTDENLDRVDNFYHSNVVFGRDEDGDQKLIRFLLNKDYPEIKSKAKVFDEDKADIFNLISAVLSKTVSNYHGKSEFIFKSMEGSENFLKFLELDLPLNNADSIPLLKSDIVLTIDTLGYIANSTFVGNLKPDEINKINYYLSRLSNLAVYEENGIKSNSNIHLKIFTISDTIKDQNKIRYGYFVAEANTNTDLLHDTTDYYAVFNSVQIEAAFPGGRDAWTKYLARNLNASVPYKNHAPSGNYTVIVSFIVDKQGKISEVRALNDPGYGTAEEAVRVIKNGPLWVPAVMNGNNVIYRQKQSITFQVSNN